MKTILILLTIFSSFASAVATPRPNVIVIMSDDVGYSDVGCFGGEISTPLIAHWPAGALDGGKGKRNK